MKRWLTAAFARSERSPLFGKRTVPLHTKVSEETADLLRVKARALRMTNSEFIAAALDVLARGRSAVEKLQKSHLDVVSAIAPPNQDGDGR